MQISSMPIEGKQLQFCLSTNVGPGVAGDKQADILPMHCMCFQAPHLKLHSFGHAVLEGMTGLKLLHGVCFCLGKQGNLL